MINPTTPDLLRAIRANLQELLLPQLEGPHARSAGQNMLILLDHALIRLEEEGPALSTDNAEKRQVLEYLNDEGRDLEDSDNLRDRFTAIRPAGRYVSIGDVAREADELRQLTIAWSQLLHRVRPTYGEQKTDELLAPLRRQLRSQMDRETAWIAHIQPSDSYDHRGV